MLTAKRRNNGTCLTQMNGKRLLLILPIVNMWSQTLKIWMQCPLYYRLAHHYLNNRTTMIQWTPVITLLLPQVIQEVLHKSVVANPNLKQITSHRVLGEEAIWEGSKVSKEEQVALNILFPGHLAPTNNKMTPPINIL